jgi:hypothetical protein
MSRPSLGPVYHHAELARSRFRRWQVRFRRLHESSHDLAGRTAKPLGFTLGKIVLTERERTMKVKAQMQKGARRGGENRTRPSKSSLRTSQLDSPSGSAIGLRAALNPALGLWSGKHWSVYWIGYHKAQKPALACHRRSRLKPTLRSAPPNSPG